MAVMGDYEISTYLVLGVYAFVCTLKQAINVTRIYREQKAAFGEQSAIPNGQTAQK